MKMKELRKQLTKEAELFVPNHCDRIKNRIVIPLPSPEPKYRASRLVNRLKPVLAFGCMAIILTLILPLLIPGEPVNQIPVSNTFITIDINPSIEIETDKSDNILNVRGLNPDAIVMLDHEIEKLTGKNVYLGLVDILTLANDTLYLDPSRTNNDIVISSVNDNQDHEDLVYAKLYEKANGFYQEKGLKGNIARVNINPELQEEAKQLQMSVGKLAKIKEAMAVKPELTFEEASAMPIRDLNNIIKQYTKDTEDFQDAYDIQLGNLVAEKTKENEDRLKEHNRTKGRVKDISDALKHLAKNHGHINENQYQKLMKEIIDSYRLLYNEFPEELSEVTDDVTIEELTAIMSAFDESVSEKIEQETEEINTQTKDLSNIYRQKVKENLEKGKERPWEVNLDDLEGDNN